MYQYNSFHLLDNTKNKLSCPAKDDYELLFHFYKYDIYNLDYLIHR